MVFIQLNQSVRTYFQKNKQTQLIELPRLASEPGYEVLEGDPVASIRYDLGNSETPHRQGIWRCTPGTFACIEQGDELQTLTKGKLTLILEDQSEHHFEPGDSFFTVKGEKVVWKIVETVEKVFFTDGVGS